MMRKIALSVLLTALLAACSSTPIKEIPTKVEDKSPPPSRGSDTQPSTQAPVSVNPLKDPNNILSKRSIYFDFDEFIVKDEFKSLVQAHAKYLTQTSSAKMTIQGNTDERGSREYNLALGQKRADAVKKALSILGAGDRQIETVSFGEEKPKAAGHDESSWAQNRRADIVYQGE
jgi:peptidoglycan-associated lipoprotein